MPQRRAFVGMAPPLKFGPHPSTYPDGCPGMPLSSDELKMVRTLLDHLLARRGTTIVARHVGLSDDQLHDLHAGRLPLTSDLLGRLLALYAQPEPQEDEGNAPRPRRPVP